MISQRYIITGMVIINMAFWGTSFCASKAKALAVVQGLDSRMDKLKHSKNDRTKRREQIEHEKARCRLFGKLKSVVPWFTQHHNEIAEVREHLLTFVVQPALGLLIAEYMNGTTIQVLNVSRDLLDHNDVIPWQSQGYGITDLRWSSFLEDNKKITALTVHVRGKADKDPKGNRQGIDYNLDLTRQFPLVPASSFSYQKKDVPTPDIPEEPARSHYGDYIPEFGARVLTHEAEPGGGCQIMVHECDLQAQQLLCEMQRIKNERYKAD